MNPGSMIRRHVKANPTAYRAWNAIRERKQGRAFPLPERGDDFYVDGFPRSGNTYVTSGVKSIWPRVKFSNHFHAIAPLKLSLRHGIPTLVLMRKPQQAIASYMVHVSSPRSRSSKQGLSEDRLCALLLTEWIEYYSFVERYSRNLSLLTSEFLFREPLAVFRHISRTGEMNTPDAQLDSAWKRFHQNFELNDQTKGQGSTSFPDPERDQRKAWLIQVVRRSPQLGVCEEIHKSLEKLCIGQAT